MTGTRILACAFMICLALGCKDATGPGNDTPGPATLKVENRTSVPILEYFFSACSDPNWGLDRLGPSETVAPASSKSFEVPPGCYDMKAIMTTGAESELSDKQLAAGATFTHIVLP